MKKIQRLIMFVLMFSIVGLGQAFGQDPNIICPADITISNDADYTFTGITGEANAYDINGEVDVEYTDIIINLDINNEGLVRRRFNVVDRTDIFCDQTITMESGDQPICKQNIVAALAQGKTRIFAQSFVQNADNLNNLKVSRTGIHFFDYVEFYCCDTGLQPYYVQFTNNVGNLEYCSGQILIEDKLAPVINDASPIYLSLYNGSSVELTVDMLSLNAYDNCGIETATFSQSVFTSAGEYLVDYILSDAAGNTSVGTITVIVQSGNFIVCNNNINVSLDGEGRALITPDMILEGAILANGDYSVSINGGPFNKTGLMTCSNQGVENQVTIRNENSGNECWSIVVIEDKLLPVLTIPNTVYMSLDVPTEAILTVEMLDRYTFDNCGIVSQTLSEDLFNSVGTYDVLYTAADAAGNTSAQTFQVIVTTGGSALSCNDEIQITLGDDDTVIVDHFSFLEGIIYLNVNYTIDIEESPNLPSASFETFELNCSHVGKELTYVVKNEYNNNTCWGNLSVLDKNAPTPYAQSVISASMNGAEPYVLNPALVDLGSFDNCGGPVSMTVSPHTFTVPGTYEVKLRVYDESGNSDFAMSTLILEQGEGESIECLGISTALISQFGSITLYAVDFVLNADDFDSFIMSTDPNGPYSESIDFNCSDYNVNAPIDVYVLGSNGGIFSSCTVSLTLIDNIPPVAIAEQNITLPLINGLATLTPEMLDNGSFDLCGSVSLSVSQTLFTTAHLGDNLVILTVTDQNGINNQTFGTVTVIDGGNLDIECKSNINASMPLFGPAVLFSASFIENPNDFNLVTISTDPNGPYTASIAFDCADYTSNTPINVYVQGTIETESAICVTSLTLIDNIAPIAISETSVTLQLVNGQATLTPAIVDDGSYDNCGEISFSLNQTLFTTAHLGDNLVTMTVTDESGNSNQASINVIVVGDINGSGCTIGDIIFPNDINITDSDGELENLSIENLQSLYNYSYSQVHPYTIADCNSIVYAYEDNVFNTLDGYKILRTFTALDWIAGSIKTKIQIIKLNITYNTTLACNDNITVNVEDGNVQLFPEDVLEGGNYDYTNMVLEIMDNGNVLPDNIISPNYIGQTLTYSVTDETTGNSCWGTISVVDSQGNCPMNIDTDVTFPLDEIYVPNSNVAADQYTPDNLVSNYGFEQVDVDVSIHSVASCTVIGFTYEDNVFNYSDGNYKIIRTFTVIDWVTYDPPSTEGIYTHIQVINVGINPNDLICDVLPNSAPAGDCDTGHTLEDDVEWPSDLSIADYRITPDGLVEFSNVPEVDAQPIFFNTPGDYTATYVDLLVELTPSTLTVARIWKAINNTYDLTWHYSQTIVVDFSGFENLVTVNTFTGRSVPEVLINTELLTNMDGEAQVESDIFSVQLEDESLNGLNIRDLILMGMHIIDGETLDEQAAKAADIDNDGNFKTSDIIQLRKFLLGITDTNSIWKFEENTQQDDQLLKPKANYTAYKPGDVDDNAILPGEQSPENEVSFSFDDQLLNIGETYMIPVKLENVEPFVALEARLNIDPTILEVINVVSSIDMVSPSFNVHDNGDLRILSSHLDLPTDISNLNESIVFYIEVTSKINGLLHDAIRLDNGSSYGVDENLDLIIIGSEIENMITGTNSPELALLKVFPNPTTDYLRIDQSGISTIGNLNVSILNTQGQLIIKQSSDVIDVRDLSPGIYYYNITVGAYETKGKFIVVR